MKKRLLLTLPLALIIGSSLFSAPATAAGGAHAHIGHVMTKWGDTPNNAGFLPTAMAEAKIAIQHAGLAAKDPANLKAMQLHAGHVLHAVDPSLATKGPGLGYGVLSAAKGTSSHVKFAAGSNDATDNVKTHARHVSASADNTVGRVAKIARLGNQVIAASSAADAAPMVKKLHTLTQALQDGQDLDGDGKVSWAKGEGGLATAHKHMGFMLKGEGL